MQTLNFSVSVDQLSYYDAVVTHGFVVDSGDYDLLVGRSSADIRLSNVFTLSLPPVILPGAPGGLTAIAYSTNVAVQWNLASRATGYNVLHSLSNSGPFTFLAAGLTNINFTDTVPVVNVTNFYQVIATNSAGASVPSVTSVFVAPYIAPPPGPPTGLITTTNGPQITLTWNPEPVATSFMVSRSDRSVGPFIELAGGSTVTNLIDFITNSSLTYYYDVTATNAAGTSVPATVSVKLTQPPPLPWQEADSGPSASRAVHLSTTTPSRCRRGRDDFWRLGFVSLCLCALDE